MPAKDLGITSIFGNAAIKRSLGVSGLGQTLPFDLSGTRAVFQSSKETIFTASSSSLVPAPAMKSMEERLFDSKANAKIYTSKVAMRINESWRKQLFRQIDSVLDADEWLEGDEPLTSESYQTFLRLMLVIQPSVKPGLGMTSGGNLMAIWQTGDARLTIYCFGDDELRYVLSYLEEGKRRTAAADASIRNIQKLLAAFQPEQWFGNESA
jgi:hypothetical protein